MRGLLGDKRLKVCDFFLRTPALKHKHAVFVKRAADGIVLLLFPEHIIGHLFEFGQFGEVIAHSFFNTRFFRACFIFGAGDALKFFGGCAATLGEGDVFKLVGLGAFDKVIGIFFEDCDCNAGVGGMRDMKAPIFRRKLFCQGIAHLFFAFKKEGVSAVGGKTGSKRCGKLLPSGKQGALFGKRGDLGIGVVELFFKVLERVNGVVEVVGVGKVAERVFGRQNTSAFNDLPYLSFGLSKAGEKRDGKIKAATDIVKFIGVVLLLFHIAWIAHLSKLNQPRFLYRAHHGSYRVLVDKQSDFAHFDDRHKN